MAEPVDGDWVVNEWVKQAILLYFRLAGLETTEIGPFEYHDKIPTKRHLAEAGHPGGARRGRSATGPSASPGWW